MFSIEMNSADLREKMVSAFDEANQYFLVNFRVCDVIDTAQQLWKVAKPWVHVLAVLTIKIFVMIGFALAFVAAYCSEVAGQMFGEDEELAAAVLRVEELIDSMPDFVERTETAPVVEEVSAEVLRFNQECEDLELQNRVEIESAPAPAKKRSNRSKKSVAASVTIPVDEI